MDAVVNNSSRSVVSRLSYDLSVTENAIKFREPYMIKETIMTIQMEILEH